MSRERPPAVSPKRPARPEDVPRDDTHRTTPQEREHVLLTVLGVAPRETTYVLNGAEERASLAPVALYRLLSEHQRPGRVVALCTEAADATFGQLASALPIDATQVSVPGGADDAAIEGFLGALTGAFDARAAYDVTIDVTHGFRHFSFLTYVGALYLQALRGDRFRVRGAHYGLYDNAEERSRFFDLRPLLELPRWVHALATLQETGSAEGIARLLDPVPQKVRNNFPTRLRELSTAHLSGLPLELGRRAFEARDADKELRKSLRHLKVPLGEELARQLSDILEPVALAPPTGSNWPSKKWKKQALLDEAELARQRRLIERLFDEGNETAAFGLLREHAVNWVLWRTGDNAQWLERPARQRAEQPLRTLAATIDGKTPARLDERQRALGKLWSALTEVRNGLHHHGMRAQDLFVDAATKRDEVRRDWKDVLSTEGPFDPLVPGGQAGLLLISPCGMAPGALYTAVLETKPARVLVLCSADSRPLAEQALDAAGFAGERVLDALERPFGPAGAPDKDIQALAQRHGALLLEASEVVVNLTGGTTWMGLLVDRLASEASRLCRPVRRLGLIDPRSPEEQRRDPFQRGQTIWLSPSTQET